jgi:hypothetical protein
MQLSSYNVLVLVYLPAAGSLQAQTQLPFPGTLAAWRKETP